MYDCGKDITAYHDERVRLSQAEQERLRSHRNANRERAKIGLAKAGDPLPLYFVKQGSYAMKTINQQPGREYDIDDGIVFAAEELQTPEGDSIEPLAARKMVCAALQDPAFSKAPEVRKNCVRIFYSAGYHVDMPVYREVSDAFGNLSLELASTTWRVSNPEGVTDWFNDAVISKSPDQTNGRQMRRIVRLLKNFSISRSTWNLPSGFVLSVLVNDSYRPVNDRDDLSFYDTLDAIYMRLSLSMIVRHPVVNEYLVDDHNDPCMKELKVQVAFILDTLRPLTQVGCTRLTALKAWKTVFNTDHFDLEIEEEKSREKQAATILTSRLITQPKPWCP